MIGESVTVIDEMGEAITGTLTWVGEIELDAVQPWEFQSGVIANPDGNVDVYRIREIGSTAQFSPWYCDGVVPD